MGNNKAIGISVANNTGVADATSSTVIGTAMIIDTCLMPSTGVNLMQRDADAASFLHRDDQTEAPV